MLIDLSEVAGKNNTHLNATTLKIRINTRLDNWIDRTNPNCYILTQSHNVHFKLTTYKQVWKCGNFKQHFEVIILNRYSIEHKTKRNKKIQIMKLYHYHTYQWQNFSQFVQVKAKLWGIINEAKNKNQITAFRLVLNNI